MNFKFISILIFSTLFFRLDAQKLVFTQISKNFSNLKIPENKSIIVFESDLDLSFTSSMEKLDSPIKKENFYYLTLTERVCIIKVINNVTKSEVELPFGQLSEKTLPIIKKGEYLVFKIDENNKELIVFNQTDVKKGEGLNDNQMLYDKEALLIINVDPFDLEIELESSQPITAIKHSGKQYKVYIKPVKQEIIVKQKGSDVQGIINIVQIDPKEVQYYYVSLPEHLRKREVIYDKNISVGDFLIESVPSGAFIEIFGNPSFNAEKNKTPYLLKGFETGFKVVTLSLSEYETFKDTIQIGSSKKNKSNYNLVPKFAFINIKVEPQFPYSSLYVDNQLFYAKNETDIKIPVSSKEVEIRAQHFESEIFKINPTPGDVISITKNMKPILGKLYLECGENAEKGKVYVSNSKLNTEKKLIGTLPINDTLILQEGQYDLIVEKEGYATYKKSIQIQKNQIKNETILLGITKEIVIFSNPENADILIDGKSVGKSELRIKLSIGKHIIEINKNNYHTFKKEIEIFEDDKDLKIYTFELLPISYFYSFKSYSTTNSNLYLYIDDKLVGKLPCNGHLTTGIYKVEIRNKGDVKDYVVYKSRLKIPYKKHTIVFPYYNNLSAEFVTSSIDYCLNEPIYLRTRVIGIGYYGFKLSICDASIQLYTKKESLFYTFEFKTGGLISNSIGFAIFSEYKILEQQQLSFGIDFRTNPRDPSFPLCLFFRSGYIINSSVTKSKLFFSLGFSTDIGRLRLWQRPIFN